MSALPQEISYFNDLYNTRSCNLQNYAHALGSDRKLAQVLDMSPTQIHRLIRKRDIPFSEKMARFIETKLNKPLGWLDGSENTQTSGVPVYFLEDLIDFQNIKPAFTFKYASQIIGAFFVQIMHSTYEPLIKKNSKILINPNKKIPQENKIYVVSFLLEQQLCRPVLKRYRDSKFLDLCNEALFISADEPHTIFGECDVIIQLIG